MPPTRNEDPAFDELDAMTLRCKLCAQYRPGTNSTLKRESRKRHLTTAIHQAAVAAGVEATDTHITAHDVTNVQEARQPVRLSFLERLLINQDESEEESTRATDADLWDVHDGHFYNQDGTQMIFGVGGEPDEENDSDIWNELESLRISRWQGDLQDDVPEDLTVPRSIAVLDNLQQQETCDSDDDSEEDTANDADWYPHGSKTMFYLDLLDNLPRLRLSDDHMKAIIWVMKECGTPNVPSLYALRKKQASLAAQIPNLKARHHTSALGNHFYMNHPIDLLSLDWSNPFVRPHIHLYPEITTVVSESWHAKKYVEEVPEAQLTPMWADWARAPHKHFYVKEIAQTRDNEYVLPLRWVIWKQKEHAKVVSLSRSEAGTFEVYDPTSRYIPCSSLKYNYLDLLQQSEHVSFNGANIGAVMPHPVREIAKGRAAFCIRIMPWADDVSGNRSKQYNAHMNIYIANTNIPHRKLNQEFFIRFCSTSPHASSSEQLAALSEDLRSTEWHPAYDCQLNDEIIFRVHGHLLASDNPQQAEETSTAGSQANFWCRSDMSGGNDQHRESNEGYHALFEIGIPRDSTTTVATIRNQLWTAGRGVQDAVDKIQTEIGVKDKIASHWIQVLIEKAREMHQDRLMNPASRDPRLNDKRVKNKPREDIKEKIKDDIQKELFEWLLTQPQDRYALIPEDSELRKKIRPGDHYNALLELEGLDPHRDTPCEILHTILLGTDKYLWHETNKVWDRKKEETFAIRLQSSSIDGLSLSAVRARYMVQYKNSLIGKHFKALQQLAVFQLHDDLCSQALFNLWKANGALGALIWFPEIRDVDVYLQDLQILLDNVLDLWAVFDPARITYKYKLHVLPHLRDDIERFGPAVLFATEIFECWNTVFRLCSILSNHQAASLDIATTLGGMERFKHQVSGGWWKSKSGEYVQAGSRIRTFLAGNGELRRRLGLTLPSHLEPGTSKPVAKRKQKRIEWSELASNVSQFGGLVPPEMKIHDSCAANNPLERWIECEHTISQTEDICRVGSWIFAQSVEEAPVDTVTFAGRIRKILTPENCLGSPNRSICIVERFTISPINDAKLDMPTLIRSGIIDVIRAKHIFFIFNAQHACHTQRCTVTSLPVTQGRDQTSRTEKVVKHADGDQFILNMHALHNGHLIREVLPRALTEPRHIFPDRRSKHDELAAGLRVTGPAKRAQALAKSKATREKKKQAKQQQMGEQSTSK